MSFMCSSCGHIAEPHAQWQNVVVCGTCGDTLVLADDGTTRKALGIDIDRLPAEALAHLRTGLRGFRSTRR